jgi:hypothetical protein
VVLGQLDGGLDPELGFAFPALHVNVYPPLLAREEEPEAS